MDALLDQIKTIIADESKLQSFLVMAVVLTVCSLVFGFIGRFVFGKKSVLNQRVYYSAWYHYELP